MCMIVYVHLSESKNKKGPIHKHSTHASAIFTGTKELKTLLQNDK